MINVLLVLGRNVGNRAIKNLEFITKLLNTTPEFKYLSYGMVWNILNFNGEQSKKIKNEYFNLIALHKCRIRHIPEISLNIISKVKYLHPAPNKLSKRTFRHFCNILYRMKDINLVITANETGRGRAAFTISVAKAHFIPYINLSGGRVKEKVDKLKAKMEILLNNDKKELMSYTRQLKLKHNIEFQFSKNIEAMNRIDTEYYIKEIKGLL